MQMPKWEALGVCKVAKSRVAGTQGRSVGEVRAWGRVWPFCSRGAALEGDARESMYELRLVISLLWVYSFSCYMAIRNVLEAATGGPQAGWHRAQREPEAD